jgi:ABC-type transport system substrate-binding protein
VGRLRVALASLVLLSACSGSVEDRFPNDFLRLGGSEEVPTLDPALGYDTTSWFFEQMLFNTLLDYDDAGELVPELAEAWTQSSDGRTLTFRLRTGVRFSNGRPLGAGDVKYSLERVLTPQTRSQGIEFFMTIEGADDFVSGIASEVRGLLVPRPEVLQVRLTRFDPLIFHKLALQFAAVVPREEVERWGDDFSRRPVGSGPFLLSEWVSGQHLLLHRNPHYYRSDQPRAAGIVRFVGLNDQLAWFRYEAGVLDVAPTIPPPEFRRVTSDARYAPLLRTAATLRTSYLGMNCEVAPFTDRRVRRAVNHAIDKAKLLRLINNRGTVADRVVPPNMPDYPSGGKVYEFDPRRARSLLASAGFPEGFRTTLWVRSDEDGRRMAQAVQQDLAEVGIRAEIRPIAWGPFLEAVKTPRLVPMFQLGWEADFPDPSNFLEVLFHSKHRGSNNDVFYSNPEVDELLDRAAVTSDPGGRMQLLRRAEDAIMEDGPWVPLYHPVTYQVVGARVRDYRLNPLRPPRLESVWLATSDAAAPPTRSDPPAS